MFSQCSVDKRFLSRVLRRSFSTALAVVFLGIVFLGASFERSAVASDDSPVKASNDASCSEAEPTESRFSSTDALVDYFNGVDSDGSTICQIEFDVPPWRYSVVKVGRIIPPPKDSSGETGLVFFCQGYGVVARAFSDDRFFVFTAAHIFEELEQAARDKSLEIKLFDGSTLKPERIAFDCQKDYLVMEFPLEGVSSKIRRLKFRNSDRVEINETIRLATPSSKNVLSLGKIAKPDDLVKNYDSNKLLTMDAQVEVGSSGSPVIDEENRAIGFVKSFYNSDKPEKRGKSFATPINGVLRFAVEEFAEE